jgi:MFS family permease
MGTLSLRYSEKIIMRFGARNALLPGVALIAVGLLLFARVPVDGNYFRDVFPSMIILALGIGVSFPALMTLAMSGATQADAGLASGLVNTTAQVGGALGLAVLATLSTTRTEHLAKAGKSTAESLVGGYHLAFIIASALVVAAFIVAVTVLEQVKQSDAAVSPETEPDGSEPAYSEAA